MVVNIIKKIICDQSLVIGNYILQAEYVKTFKKYPYIRPRYIYLNMGLYRLAYFPVNRFSKERTKNFGIWYIIYKLLVSRRYVARIKKIIPSKLYTHTIPKMLPVSSYSSLCLIHWIRALSRESRCSWSGADRRCSNYIWVINHFITQSGAMYIRGLTVILAVVILQYS